MLRALSPHTESQVAAILARLNQVILGKEEQVKLALTCILANGHLLIEDLPGMGKTTLSHALANVFGLHYQRIQFTSDMLPADLVGVSIFNKAQSQFEFHQGPVFHQLLLADEINRANPKTQSALLEAMEEKQVSVDGNTYALPAPFFVIATKNPVHQSGTFPLPESQLDRFLMRLQLDFPPEEAELALLKEGKGARADTIDQTLLTESELSELQQAVQAVEKSDACLRYILRLLQATREPGKFPNSLSPRAGLAIVSAAQSYAFISGRSFITPDDVKAIFPAVAEHRLRSGTSAGLTTHYSEQVLSQVDPIS